MDKKENTLRFRQVDPQEAMRNGFTEYITKQLGDSGIQLILGYKKAKRGKGASASIMHFIEQPQQQYPMMTLEEELADLETELKQLYTQLRKYQRILRASKNPEDAEDAESIINELLQRIEGISEAMDIVESEIADQNQTDTEGSGFKRNKISPNIKMPKFEKGSQAAKDHMAKIRSMRGGNIRMITSPLEVSKPVYKPAVMPRNPIFRQLGGMGMCEGDE